MKAIATTLVLSLTMSILTVHAAMRAAEFQKTTRKYIDGLLQASPDYATELGDHRLTVS